MTNFSAETVTNLRSWSVISNYWTVSLNSSVFSDEICQNGLMNSQAKSVTRFKKTNLIGLNTETGTREREPSKKVFLKKMLIRWITLLKGVCCWPDGAVTKVFRSLWNLVSQVRWVCSCLSCELNVESRHREREPFVCRGREREPFVTRGREREPSGKLESLDRSWLRCAWTDWNDWVTGKLEKLWFSFVFWVFEWKATYLWQFRW